MSDVVTRLNAALQGRYHIESELGEGGMANVYLADDLRHDRKVALKVLKQELAAVVGAERFLAEIKTTANLQHPSVLPLFDSGEADGYLFYVMPFVEGQTLRRRLDREVQLPIEEAVGIVTAVAGALDHAHARGVIHRDIKPGNILLQEGHPLVADFGISLAVGAAGGGRLTETGLSVGTPAYMSPEQAIGEGEVGHASDTYSLACVLYEMLVGAPPRTGSTAQAILAKVIAGEPVSTAAARASTPPNVDAAIRKALEKVPADRFRSTRDFANALNDPSFRHDAAAAGAPAGAGGIAARSDGGPARSWTALTTLFAGLSAILALVIGWAAFGEAEPTPVEITRFDIATPQAPLRYTMVTSMLSVSADGRRIVFTVAGDGFWYRDLDQLDPVLIAGTAGGIHPTLSPDGNEVAFEQDDGLRVVAIEGGPVRSLFQGTPGALVLARLTPDWGPDGLIYYKGPNGLLRIDPEGMDVESLTASEGGHHVFPEALPNGIGVIFRDYGVPDLADVPVKVLDLRSGEVRELFRAFWGTVRYSPTGHLIFSSPDGTLFARRFDLDRLEVTGEAVPWIEGSGAFHFAISPSGTVVYVGGNLLGPTVEPVWVDRQGQETPIDPGWSVPSNDHLTAELSPDGSRLAISYPRGELTSDLHVVNLVTGQRTDLSTPGRLTRRPTWYDDESLLFISDRASWSVATIWRARADGRGDPVEVVSGVEAGEAQRIPGSDLIVFRTGSTTYALTQQLFVAREGDVTGRPLLDSGFNESRFEVSPDGRWIAYTSDRAGQGNDVWVAPLPDPSLGAQRVSYDGGLDPVWSPAGDELFYRTPDRRFVAVTVRGQPDLPGGPSFEYGPEVTLFEAEDYVFPGGLAPYDVGPGAERFVMFRVVDRSAGPRGIFVVTNATSELPQLTGS